MCGKINIGRGISFLRGAPPFCCRALRDIFAERSITGVIHIAGLKAVGESVRLPLAYYRNNLDSCLRVLEVMQEFGEFKVLLETYAKFCKGEAVNPN